MATYGDGVSDVDLARPVALPPGHGKLATVTAVRPPAASAAWSSTATSSREFTEKPQIGEGWINGGFLVLEPEVLDYIDGDDDEPRDRRARAAGRRGQLVAYRHEGFWQCMDTLRDKRLLDSAVGERAGAVDRRW